MRKSQAFKYVIVLFIMNVCCCLFAAAQQGFRYKAILDSVPHDGFYTIPLSPAVVADCQLRLDDMRIKDETGSDVPYTIRQTSVALV